MPTVRRLFGHKSPYRSTCITITFLFCVHMTLNYLFTHLEHRVKPSIRITADSYKDVHTIICDAGVLASEGTGPLPEITFTIDTQCGTIQGTAKDLADKYSSIITTTSIDVSSLLVTLPLPDYLWGSNISCQVRQRRHLEVHQSAKIRLCKLQYEPDSAQGK